MNDDIIQPFIQATITCFEKMMQVEAEAKDPQKSSSSIDPDHIVTSMELVGEHLKIHTALSLDRETAQTIVEAMLFEGSTETEEELCDAIGEVINIIAGNAKAFFREYQLGLTIPSTTSGQTTLVSVPKNVELTEIGFHLPDTGDFKLFVGLKSDEE